MCGETVSNRVTIKLHESDFELASVTVRVI